MIDISCFGSNYIGIRNCSEDEPMTGIYVDDIIKTDALRLAAAIADGAGVTGKETLQRLHDLAIRKVWQDLQNKLKRYFAFSKVIQRRRVGGQSRTTFLDPINGNVGVKIEQTKRTEYDQYLRLYIESLSIRTNNNVEGKQITITDGCSTKQVTVNLNAGCDNIINLNFPVNGLSATILMDANDVQLASSVDDYYKYGQWDYYCHGCYEDVRYLTNGCGCSRNYVRAVGIDENGAETGQKYGMLIHARVECSNTSLMCSLVNHLGLAVAYRFGIEILQAHKGSRRRNELATQSEEETDYMLTQLQGGVDTAGGGFATFGRKGEYKTEIENLVTGLKEDLRKEQSKCVSCKNVRKVVHIP